MTSPDIRDPIRVAMVGLGVWGRSQMQHSVLGSPFVECIAAFDLDPSETEAFCAEHSTRPLPRFDAILEDDEIEAVLVFTPNPEHPWQARRLAEAGKHVYLTKPIANYAREAVDMIETARKAETVLFVDHGASVSPEIKAIKRVLAEGLIGDVLMAQTNRSNGIACANGAVDVPWFTWLADHRRALGQARAFAAILIPKSGSWKILAGGLCNGAGKTTDDGPQTTDSGCFLPSSVVCRHRPSRQNL